MGVLLLLAVAAVALGRRKGAAPLAGDPYDQYESDWPDGPTWPTGTGYGQPANTDEDAGTAGQLVRPTVSDIDRAAFVPLGAGDVMSPPAYVPPIGPQRGAPAPTPPIISSQRVAPVASAVAISPQRVAPAPAPTFGPVKLAPAPPVVRYTTRQPTWRRGGR